MISKKKILIIIPIILLIALDQIFKIYVKLNMRIHEEIEIFSWFKINFIENNGMAFGYEFGGEKGKLFLTIFRIIAVFFISVWLRKLILQKERKIIIYSVVFILSGAIGNIIDSVFYGFLFSESTVSELSAFMPEGGGYAPLLHGKVVDMLYFPLWEGFLPEWLPFLGGDYFIFFEPIFNMADSYVSIGIILMLIYQIIINKK